MQVPSARGMAVGISFLHACTICSSGSSLLGDSAATLAEPSNSWNRGKRKEHFHTHRVAQERPRSCRGAWRNTTEGSSCPQPSLQTTFAFYLFVYRIIIYLWNISFTHRHPVSSTQRLSDNKQPIMWSAVNQPSRLSPEGSESLQNAYTS